MKFFVTDHDYRSASGDEAASDAHDTLEDAAAYAVDAVLNSELHTALIVGMESETYRTDVPSYIALIVRAGADFHRIP